MNQQFTAIIGHPLAHTLSPRLHNYVYPELGIEAKMLVLDTPDLSEAVAEIKAKPIALSAVTIPYKQAIINHLDKVDEIAKSIGAVNTIINKDGELVGYNTDIVGIERALVGVELKDKRVLLLGAGGAARPVAFLVNNRGGKLLCDCRSEAKGKSLVATFGGTLVDMSDLEAKEIDVIINATPVGMYPNPDALPIDPTLLAEHQVVFDLVYNPLQTKLLQTAGEKGAKTISGLTMFIAQGLEQIRLWSGKSFDPSGLFEMLSKEINQ